jgi:starch-binding outer membrane protein, SusD/RagB family
MNSKIFSYFFSAIMLLSLISCEKNIQIDPPSSLDGSAGFKSKQDVEAALLGCYNSMQSANYVGLRYWALCDMYADNIAHVGTFPSFAQVANRGILADNAEVNNMWLNIYSGINRMNTVIDAAGAVDDKSFNNAAAIAEARLLRAFQYFNLLRFFGGSETGYNKSGGLGVPIILKPTLTSKEAVAVARSSEADVWKQILEDIDFAVGNLPNSTATGRVNKRVAFALKARAHLYREEWTQAEVASDSVIVKGGYSLLSSANYATIFFQKGNSENIWELVYDPTNTSQSYFFFYPTSLGGRNEISATTTLRDASEANDVRKAVNYTTTPAAKTLKFTRSDGTDNNIMIRLAEMYLIRAEARAKLNKLTESLADLNVIRKRAGITDATATTEATLLTAIEKERRIELAFEGHRWFDIRRYNKLASVNITQTFRALWPIPQREVLTSNNVIAQNPSY